MIEEGKSLLAVTSFEASSSVSNISFEDNSFSITRPGFWLLRGGSETIIGLRKLLDLREQNVIELHVEEAGKRGSKKIGENEYKTSNLVTRKFERIEELKNVECNDLEDMVFRFQLTYIENLNILDMKYINTSTIGKTLPILYQYIKLIILFQC